MALLVIMVSITFPQVSRIGFSDSRNKTARWMIVTTLSLKSRTAMERRPHVLRVDTARQTLTALAAEDVNTLFQQMGRPDDEKSPESAPGAPEFSGGALARFELPERMTVEDVMFAGSDTVHTGVVDIVFHARGYADWAVIHMRDRERRISFIIEPFLCRVKMVDGHVVL